MRFNVRARTLSALNQLADPASAGQLEAVQWRYFDTQTITSGTTKTLSFFTAVQSDPTLGNLEQAGTIQSPNYFEIYCVKCDFLAAVTDSATANAGTLNDIATVLFTQRATYEFKLNSKSYGVFPLSFTHGSGGPVGLVQGTPAASHVESYANNSVPDDGDWWGGCWQNPDTGLYEECGGVTLKPTQSFVFQVNMAAPPTLSGNINMRISLCGVLHRQVR